ncbi:hypothetical protein MMC07_006221 [Pseudocyphellaria aurata]|nr:hypothetical protein [Pseudocyphellaria aurata]
MTPSSSDDIHIPAIAKKSTWHRTWHPSAPMIIFSLWYYGCDVDNIFRVLRSYGFRDTRRSVVKFIKEKKLSVHLDKRRHPINGIEAHTRLGGTSSETTVVVEFVQTLPMTIDINSGLLPALTPTEHVLAQAADGRRISTSVPGRQVLCWISQGTIPKESLNIPLIEKNGPWHPSAGMIIFSLYHFGCDLESIFRVLKSYQFRHSIDSVARYVKRENFSIQHLNALKKPGDGRMIQMRSWGHPVNTASVIVYFANQLPVKMEMKSSLLPALVPEEKIIVQAADGRKIGTSVTCEQVVCSVCP